MVYLYAAAGAVITGALYLGYRQVRRFFNWSDGGDNPPRERIIAHLPMSILAGAMLGWFCYEPVQAALICYEQARPLVECLMP
ncbi:hypothetical protein [Microbulbifer sp. HZ11]|uniref:hypothetical protein n=1 Tax=Microbulbifer sp. HZ11 TaxID=1453501 RepID=UPI0005BCFFA9|nr:hypothetical protein [Microbulbifer sp. HZ11]